MREVVQNQDVVLLCVGARRRDIYKETYLDTAHNLLTALEHAPTVKQVIYTSSHSIYGDKKGEWVVDILSGVNARRFLNLTI